MKKALVLAIVAGVLSAAANSGNGSIYYVPISTSIVDGDTFCGGAACTSADTIIIRGGARGDLLIQNLDGGGDYITVQNDDSTRVMVTGNIRIENSAYVDLRGDNLMGETYGIKIINSLNRQASVWVRGTANHIKISYIETTHEGSTSTTLTGIFIQDGSLSNSVIWDTIEIHHNYIHDTRYAGMYIGQNNPSNNDNPYVANLSVHDNILEDLGAYGMCMKGVHSNSGTCSIYNNTIKTTGLVWGGDGNKTQGISVGPFRGSVYTDIYNNTITNTVGPGIRITGREGVTNAHQIYNNKILGCGTGNNERYGNGIVLILHTTGVDVYDNIIIQPTRYGIWAQNSTVSSTDSRNLIGDAGQGERYVQPGGSMTEGTGADANIYHADVADFGFKVWSDDGDYSNDDFSLGILVETPVTSTTINAAIASAQPGDCVIIPDGTYSSLGQIDIFVNGVGGNPIILKAETPGGVTFSGSLNMTVTGNYWIIKDFKFDSVAGIEPITTKILMLSGSNHTRITNNKFLDCGWYGDSGRMVDFASSSDCRLDHNYFEGIYARGVSHNITSLRTQIDHNHFKDTNNINAVLHLGTDTGTQTDTYLVVEYNLFDNVSGNPEAISNKASSNTYRYNVFENSQAIVIRGGNDCVIDSNYFKDGELGVRLHGKRHVVKNNYFEGLTGYWSLILRSYDPTHARAEDALIVSNTFVDSIQTGIAIGDGIGTPPGNIIFKNNLIQQSQGKIINKINGTDLSWVTNLHYNSDSATYWTGDGEPATGITKADPDLINGYGIYRLQASSVNAIENGTPDTNVTDDIDGQPRDGTNPDIGCDEYSASAPIRTPVTEDEVGPDWIGNPPPPTCQNQGYHCCYSCLAEHYPEYDCDCAGLICCQSCLPPLTIPQDEWSLLWVDSEETEGEQDGHAVNSFDGNLDTIWHTEWYLTDPDPCHPHEIQIDLGGFYDICGFRQLPRQGEYPNGMIKGYEFYVSNNADDWGATVASGTWTAGKMEKQVSFDRKLGKYVRLVARSEVNGEAWTTMAELNVLAVQPDSDINDDGKVNLEDFAVLSVWWDDENGCSSPGWCGGADFDMSGVVDFTDLAYFVENWLRQAG